ncbi:FMN reductase [Rhizobiales bacterium RZME27]|uniref:FMN reductase n=2 Tax=Endobacterium cereale TaxID=2663029 RepID=A0A6A8A8J5_9HYPH|nr:FMN reductase [Endobacterium cereale]
MGFGVVMTPQEDAETARLAFRDAMSRLAAAVHVVTTDGPAGRAGFTASAVTSVTDTPPTLLVCLNRASSVAGLFEKNNVLCVSTLTASQENISRAFGGSTPQEERFATGEWMVGDTGAPVLKNALVSFDCRIESAVASGTHHVLFCQVLGMHTGSDDEDALVYFRRRYHSLG